LFVFMSRESYRASAFLDARIRRSAPGGLEVPLHQLLAQPVRRRPCRFVFHVGHTCSTLLSRAIEDLPGTHVLREPPVLTDLAQFGADRRRAVGRHVFALLGKTYRTRDVAVIKPSSLANGVMPAALASPGHRALFLYCALPSFLANMLKCEDNQADGLADLAVRLRAGSMRVSAARVRRQPIARQLAALWLMHVELYLQLAARVPASRLRSLDADELLAAPAACLAQLGRFFGLRWSPHAIASVVEGPTFRADAKQPARAFDPRARRSQLAAARTRFASEIDDATAWCARITRDRPIPIVLPRPLNRRRAA
jgi:hypothetical protein